MDTYKKLVRGEEVSIEELLKNRNEALIYAS